MARLSNKTIVKRKLLRLGFETSIAEYFADSIRYCVNKGILPVDVVLDHHIYPTLEKMYGDSTRTIETRMVRGIKKAWSETKHEKFNNELDYDHRPTVRKLILLLLAQIDY